MSWHIYSVNFKFIHFLLWTKGSHQSPNFDPFACSSENLRNSSCHFPNHMSVFLQIFHYFSVSWRQTLNTLHNRNQSKCKLLRLFECSHQNSPISCHFRNNKSVFLQILHYSSGSGDITPMYFFNWNFIYFQQKESIKVQIWWNFTWAVKSLKFYTLMSSFFPNHVQFQL